MINIEFTESEVQNLLALINSAPIKGEFALPVAQLQIKLSGALPKPEVKEEKKSK